MFSIEDNVYKSSIVNGSIRIEESSSNEILIIALLLGHKFKLLAPFFDIEGVSPINITVTPITGNLFRVIIITPENLINILVPRFTLELFNPQGTRLTRLVAPGKSSTV